MGSASAILNGRPAANLTGPVGGQLDPNTSGVLALRETADGREPALGPGPCVDWLVWQLTDSSFPTGGFAHSAGLEAAFQQGEVLTGADLSEFLLAYLTQTGRAAVPFVNEAFHRSECFSDLDRWCDVFMTNHVANRGSRAQGQAFLRASEAAFANPELSKFCEEVKEQRLPAHFAPVFGRVLRTLHVEHLICVRLFLFLSMRTVLGSGVRLGIVGPMAAQSLQARFAHQAEAIAQRSAKLRKADAAQTTPLLEILHAAHDRLYSRLFQT